MISSLILVPILVIGATMFGLRRPSPPVWPPVALCLFDGCETHIALELVASKRLDNTVVKCWAQDTPCLRCLGCMYRIASGPGDILDKRGVCDYLMGWGCANSHEYPAPHHHLVFFLGLGYCCMFNLLVLLRWAGPYSASLSWRCFVGQLQ